MTLPLFFVDTFTIVPFSGAPVAVCLLEEQFEAGWRQQAADELNQSATAFLLPSGDDWQLWCHSPMSALADCATGALAAAHVLWATDRASTTRPLTFLTDDGPLSAEHQPDWIQILLPRLDAAPAGESPYLGQVLGGTDCEHYSGGDMSLAVMADEQAVRAIAPDFTALRNVPIRRLIVAAPLPAEKGYSFVCRSFAPALGLDEEPVSGAAWRLLAPFWEKRLVQTPLLAWQASRRGGVVWMRVEGSRVRVAGRAVIVAHGGFDR